MIDWNKKAFERWREAEKLTPEQATARFEQLYVEDADCYGLTEDVIRDHAQGEYPRMRIYGTEKMTLNLDADWIVRDATEDLHEEAYANIPSERILELQVMLDAWCEKVRAATDTYYADWQYAIVLPEVEIEEDGEDGE